MRNVVLACLAVAVVLSTAWAERRDAMDPIGKVVKTDAEWRSILTPEQYRILREKGTERAFSGQLWNEHRDGVYACAGCALELFRSSDKFESGTGWPSFTKPLSPDRVRLAKDRSFFTVRTEVLCARCDGHLGHVFDDGPPPTNQRYCMNSGAMRFLPTK